MAGRSAGADSSSALSPKQRTALWQQLRKLDREICKIDKRLRFFDFNGCNVYRACKEWTKEFHDLQEKRKQVDEKRKAVRLKMKDVRR